MDLNPLIKTKTVIEATIEFKKDALVGELQMTKEGYHGQHMRKDFNERGKESYIKSMVEQNEWTVHSSQFENLTNLDEPIKEFYELTFSNESSLADIIYLDPMVGSGIKENPFKAERREYPVDFGSPFELTSVIKVKIPEGYIAEELPAPMAVSLPEKGGRFLYNVMSRDGVISLTSMFTISKGIYTQLEYQSLKEFYAQAISKQEEQIVLKKATD